MSDARLGRVTAVATALAPLQVQLNGDTAPGPAAAPGGVTLAVEDEVAVINVEGRRLVIWP